MITYHSENTIVVEKQQTHMYNDTLERQTPIKFIAATNGMILY
jgi:hypothetical protein